MNSQPSGPALPNSNTSQVEPEAGARYNFRSSPRGYLVPLSVAANPRLSDGAKLMWGVIRQLQFEDGCCYASDLYLAERLAVAARTARRYCQELRQEGLLEVKQRLGRPSIRFLLWQPSFKTDRRGRENPGPDDDQNGPPDPVENPEVPRTDLDATMAEFGRHDGQIRTSYPNLMNGVLNGVLSNNNNSAIEGHQAAPKTPSAAAAAAQKPTRKTRAAGSDKYAELRTELEALGITRNVIERALTDLPADYPALDVLDYGKAAVKSPLSKIQKPGAFIIGLLLGRVALPPIWETRSQRAAREKQEAELAALNARQMDLDLQVEAELDAQADAKVEELKTAAPEKYAELLEQSKRALASTSEHFRRELEWNNGAKSLRPMIEQNVWAIVRSEIRAAHYNRHA